MANSSEKPQTAMQSNPMDDSTIAIQIKLKVIKIN